MVRTSKGLRTGTRRKLSTKARHKFTVTPYLREFKEDDRVVVLPNPSSHNGMPHIRFKGAAGVVKGRKGDSYTVEVNIGNKTKTIIARPEHLNPA
jgi:large subunit ribosomal protein L21e